MFTKVTEFSMQSSDGTAPFEWMISGVSAAEITNTKGGTAGFVRNYTKSIIAATNGSKASDTTVYRAWRSKSGELERAVAEIELLINNGW